VGVQIRDSFWGLREKGRVEGIYKELKGRSSKITLGEMEYLQI